MEKIPNNIEKIAKVITLENWSEKQFKNVFSPKSKWKDISKHMDNNVVNKKWQ
jgi:hypothetical protein